MRPFHLIFAAVAIGSMTTAAQASCSSEHVNSTRLNPTELSGYQKCWLKEHKSEEKIGTVGTLFYVQATEEDYVSMPVSSLVKMGEEAGAEFVTDRVMELTIRELNGIVDSDEVVKHQEEIIELDEEHKSLKYTYENKLSTIAKLEDQVTLLAKNNAMHMKSIIDLFAVNEILNESYSQYYSDELQNARNNTAYWVGLWSEAYTEKNHLGRQNDHLIKIWGEAVSERDLAEDSVVLLEDKIETLETSKDDFNEATKLLKERQTEGYALVKERDDLLRQVKADASELGPDGKLNVKGMLAKIEFNESTIETLQGVRDDLLKEKADLEFDLKLAEVQRDEAISLNKEYQAMKDAVSKTVTKGLEHAADMYAQGFKDGYEQGYAVGYVDGYNTAIEDFTRDDL